MKRSLSHSLNTHHKHHKNAPNKVYSSSSSSSGKKPEVEGNKRKSSSSSSDKPAAKAEVKLEVNKSSSSSSSEKMKEVKVEVNKPDVKVEVKKSSSSSSSEKMKEVKVKVKKPEVMKVEAKKSSSSSSSSSDKKRKPELKVEIKVEGKKPEGKVEAAEVEKKPEEKKADTLQPVLFNPAQSPAIMRLPDAVCDSLSQVEYVGILRLTSGFVPEKSCKSHMLSDLPGVFPAVTQLEMIVEESEQIAENRLCCVPTGIPVLSLDQAIAICSYTFDLGFHSKTSDGSDNLFEQLNRTLRTRDPSKMLQLRPYLYFLMSGLSALPDWKGTVFRGVPASAFDVVKENYALGKDVHWSSFTSTSTSLSKAKEFAHGKGGIIFSIGVVTGRQVSAYSAFKRENEILLGPNTRLVVTSDLIQNSDGFFDISLQQRVGKGFIF